ncbi:MAG: glycoside hydrolase domain-containing protein [Terriglobia bacterium]
MPSYRRLILCLACLLWAGNAAAEPRANVKVWFVDSLFKMFPADLPGTHRLASPQIVAARNGHASLQLAIRSSSALSGVTAEVNVKDRAGKPLAGSRIRPVGYVVVGSHTKDTPPDELVGEAPGWFPDPLTEFPIDLPANRTHTLWITVAVPADAAPGEYRGDVQVRAGNQNLARASFSLRVMSATVPEARTLKVTNWFNLSGKASKQFYGVEIFSPEWWTLVENLARVMAEHRQNVVITPLMQLVEPRVEGGELRYGFANFDRWVETFRRAGVIGYIEGGHLLGRSGDSYQGGTQVDTFQIVEGKVQNVDVPADDPRGEQFLAGFLPALNSHLEEKKWKSIYFQHILDEAHGPEPPIYARYAGYVRKYMPGVLTMDAVDAEHMPPELQQNCDIWVPILGNFSDKVEMIASRQASGHEVWFYTCLFPNERHLNRLIDYPLLKVRLLHWLDFRYGLTGYLHWGWNYWSPEPFNDTQPVINANTELLPPGDAFIVYPDRANKSVFTSIRLEAMREGIEDYELLRLLNQKNPSEAEALGKAAIAGFTDYVRDPAAFRKIERRLLEELSRN